MIKLEFIGRMMILSLIRMDHSIEGGCDERLDWIEFATAQPFLIGFQCAINVELFAVELATLAEGWFDCSFAYWPAIGSKWSFRRWLVGCATTAVFIAHVLRVDCLWRRGFCCCFGPVDETSVVIPPFIIRMERVQYDTTQTLPF